MSVMYLRVLRPALVVQGTVIRKNRLPHDISCDAQCALL